jgi:hypothetical protein
LGVPPKRRLRKIVDEEALVSCASGAGLLREEVWEDATGEVVRYNLAFINHFMTSKDNGRVPGYDNAHGTHHRHFYGVVETISSTGYEELVLLFLDEVQILRREMR